MELYPEIKRNQLLMHAPTRTNLRNIMLSERSQIQKITYYMAPFIRRVQQDKAIEIESRLVVA